MSEVSEIKLMEACRVTEFDLYDAEEYALQYGGKRGTFNLRAAANFISRRIRERVQTLHDHSPPDSESKPEPQPTDPTEREER